LRRQRLAFAGRLSLSVGSGSVGSGCPLVVLRLRLVEALWMGAGGAELGRFLALVDVTAVAAVPLDSFVALEDGAVLDPLQEPAVALLVLLLDLGYLLEQLGDLIEALLLGLFGHPAVHVCPLVVLALGCFQQVRGGVANEAKLFRPDLGVLLLVVRCLLEDGRDLVVALAAGH